MIHFLTEPIPLRDRREHYKRQGLDQDHHLLRNLRWDARDDVAYGALPTGHRAVPARKANVAGRASRGMLALLRYDDGTEKCVGCDLCEAACPSRVIRVVSAEVPGEPTKRYSKEYYMDMTRCLFCGLCVDACPVDALGMTREFEWSVYDKRSNTFFFFVLLGSVASCCVHALVACCVDGLPTSNRDERESW